MPLALSAWYLWGGLFGLLWFICLVSAGVLTWKKTQDPVRHWVHPPASVDRRSDDQQEARSLSAGPPTVGAALRPLSQVPLEPPQRRLLALTPGRVVLTVVDELDRHHF
jgi:hypothetical protein